MAPDLATDTNILFLQARRRIELLSAFRSAFSERGYNARFIATDIDDMDPISYSCDKALRLVDGSKACFIADLARICNTEAVDLIIPWQDTDIQALAEHRSVIDTRVLMPPVTTVKTCIDKKATKKVLQEAGISTPGSYPNESSVEFPAIIKPFNGAGSVNVYKCHDLEELRVFKRRIDPVPALIEELVEGTEFTIDCFAGRDGRLVSACPRRRVKTRGGEVLNSATTEDTTLTGIAERICQTLDFQGPFNFQAIKTAEDQYKVTEINPRFSGGCTLSIAAGWKAPVWTIDLLEEKNSSESGPITFELFMLRYHSAIYKEGANLLSQQCSDWDKQQD